VEALELAEAAPLDLEHRGLLLRVRAECLAALNRSGWADGFAQAKALLKGRALGICLMEEGSQRLLKADFVGAQRSYSEGYALLRSDPYFGAWLKYNLGILCLQQVSAEAEIHFLEMQRLTRSADAAGFRARAWCGLGAARRVLGEWSRAESAYRSGLACAAEPDDQFEAQRGLGYTLRLAGRTAEALEALYEAALLGGEREPSEQVDIAATLALRGDEVAALAVLQQVQHRLTRPQHVERAQIIRAELYRREGRNLSRLRQKRCGLERNRGAFQCCSRWQRRWVSMSHRSRYENKLLCKCALEGC
jgi:tetratricopeptide (TPR) repeat protein